ATPTARRVRTPSARSTHRISRRMGLTPPLRIPAPRRTATPRPANSAALIDRAEECGARDAELRRLGVALQVGDQPPGARGQLRAHSRYRLSLRGSPPRFRVGERLPGALDFGRIAAAYRAEGRIDVAPRTGIRRLHGREDG